MKKSATKTRNGARRREPLSPTRRVWLLIALPALAAALALGVQRSGDPAAASRSPFDGARAFADLETVVGFGPRPAGSEASRRTRDYIVAELRAAGFEPEIDAFTASTPVGPVEMANIRAIHPGAGAGIIAVGGHYDTKRYDFEFVGANDAGSSTAVLLELARAASGLELAHTLEFIFFDGEEAILNWTATDSLYGSRYDVSRRIDAGALGDLRALILVDMVGDRDLEILWELSSTPWLRELVWDVAGALGYAAQFGRRTGAIEDDHIPYLRAGVPAIDLIDFDYPYWHTAEDTLDKTSADSLQVVGDVVYRALEAVDERLAP